MQQSLDEYQDTNISKTQQKRILKMLKQADFVPTAALRIFSYQYNARIYELRKQGWHINSVKDDQGRCGFELTGSMPKW